VRALHPLDHLDREELDFICHQVASNALRLRQVLANPADDEDHDPGQGDEDEDRGDGEPIPRDPDELRAWVEDREPLAILRGELAAGGLDVDELLKAMARTLGWVRISRARREVLAGVINTASRRRIAINRAGWVELYARSIDGYDKDFLKDQFLAALSAQSGGYVEREDALRAFARWMGFLRTGSRIVEHGEAVVRSLVRTKRLLVQGSCVKRAPPAA